MSYLLWEPAVTDSLLESQPSLTIISSRLVERQPQAIIAEWLLFEGMQSQKKKFIMTIITNTPQYAIAMIIANVHAMYSLSHYALKTAKKSSISPSCWL